MFLLARLDVCRAFISPFHGELKISKVFSMPKPFSNVLATQTWSLPRHHLPLPHGTKGLSKTVPKDYERPTTIWPVDPVGRTEMPHPSCDAHHSEKHSFVHRPRIRSYIQHRNIAVSSTNIFEHLSECNKPSFGKPYTLAWKRYPSYPLIRPSIRQSIHPFILPSWNIETYTNHILTTRQPCARKGGRRRTERRTYARTIVRRTDGRTQYILLHMHAFHRFRTGKLYTFSGLSNQTIVYLQPENYIRF